MVPPKLVTDPNSSVGSLEDPGPRTQRQLPSKFGFYNDHPIGVNARGEVYFRYYSSITGSDHLVMYGDEVEPNAVEIERFRSSLRSEYETDE